MQNRQNVPKFRKFTLVLGFVMGERDHVIKTRDIVISNKFYSSCLQNGTEISRIRRGVIEIEDFLLLGGDSIPPPSNAGVPGRALTFPLLEIAFPGGFGQFFECGC